MARGFKKDAEARYLWGAAYDAIPKSAFAVVAWHLANLCGDGEAGGAVERFAEEVRALGLNDIIDGDQAAKIAKTLKAEGMLA